MNMLYMDLLMNMLYMVLLMRMLYMNLLVPAHDSLVPAENRPQWVNLPPGEVGHG
jgi:hypothetical protein